MKPRYYFDTSVFGGVFDEDFSQSSLRLFERVKQGEIICLYSKLVEQEINKAPPNVRFYVNSLPESYVERIPYTADYINLATLYIIPYWQ